MVNERAITEGQKEEIGVWMESTPANSKGQREEPKLCLEIENMHNKHRPLSQPFSASSPPHFYREFLVQSRLMWPDQNQSFDSFSIRKTPHFLNSPPLFIYQSIRMNGQFQTSFVAVVAAAIIAITTTTTTTPAAPTAALRTVAREVSALTTLNYAYIPGIQFTHIKIYLVF